MRSTKRPHLVIVLLAVLYAASALAGDSPVAVSPGDAAKLILIESRCPTFSWGEAEGARSYELVVYRVGDEAQEARPVLKQEIPGSALSWTPALGSCLERGGQYAWSLRAVGDEAISKWSVPSLFQVASGPSEAEFEAAVAVVRSYLDAGGGAVASASGPVGATQEAKESPPQTETESSAPTPTAVGTTKLTVDGNIDAISFTGDGGSLTGIDTDPANELQTLSRTGTDVMLSAGGGSVSVEDDDASSTNELNTGFELNGTTLEITDTGSTKSVDLAALTAPPLDSLDGLDGLACNGGTGTLSLLYRNDGNDRLPVMRCVVGDPCAIVAAIDDPAPISAAYAIGLCSVPANGGVIDARYVRANGDPMAHSSQVGILTDFGPNNLPREGATMLALSTGRARDATDPDACGTAHCEGLGVGAFPSAQFPVSSPACPDSLAPWDDVGLELTVRAPADATGLSFDFQFFSFEYRDGLCSTEGNDHFVALMGPPGPGIPADGNIALQDSGFGLVPINVQLLTWKICLNGGGVNTCTGVEELTGTGFDTWEVPGPTGADTLAGSSDWVTATAPVVGGQELTLRFAIWEGDDGFFDSTVLIDNFQWVVP